MDSPCALVPSATTKTAAQDNCSARGRTPNPTQHRRPGQVYWLAFETGGRQSGSKGRARGVTISPARPTSDAGDARLLARCHSACMAALTGPAPGLPPGAQRREEPRLRPQCRLGQRAVSRDALRRYRVRRRHLPVTLGQPAGHLAAPPQIRLKISHQARPHRARANATARSRHGHPAGLQARRPHPPVPADQPALTLTSPTGSSSRQYSGGPGGSSSPRPGVISEAVTLPVDHANQLRRGAEARRAGPHRRAGDSDERPGRNCPGAVSTQAPRQHGRAASGPVNVKAHHLPADPDGAEPDD